MYVRYGNRTTYLGDSQKTSGNGLTVTTEKKKLTPYTDEETR